jgi:hypothetical protein
MKWPYNKRLDPILPGTLVTVAAGATFAIPPSLASPHVPWAWPTNWMAVPVAALVLGFVLLAVPLKRAEAPPPPPLDKRSGAYRINPISAELELWHEFFAEAAKSRRIDLFGDMPAADGLTADDGSPFYVLPDPLRINLVRVYSYLAGLKEAHDRIKRWQRSDQVVESHGKEPEGSGIGGALSDATATVIASVGIFGVKYAWLSRRLKRAQVKNQEYQERLKQLPGVLSALRGDLETVAAGAPGDGKAYATVELPAVPVIEAGSHGSIDFELVPVKSYA